MFHRRNQPSVARTTQQERRSSRYLYLKESGHGGLTKLGVRGLRMMSHKRVPNYAQRIAARVPRARLAHDA
jgi:hypothetical protein